MENQETRGSPILLGDCRLVMQGLEPESFHTCITSPPYYGLRQYLAEDAVILRRDLTNEQKQYVADELIKHAFTQCNRD